MWDLIPAQQTSASSASSSQEELTNPIHSPLAGSSTPGRKPSQASELRKSIVDPWRQKYGELTKCTHVENKVKYVSEDYVIQTVKHYFPITSNEDTQILVRLRKLFQFAPPQCKKPTAHMDPRHERLFDPEPNQP